MLLLWWCPFKIQKENLAGLQITSTDYLSIVLTPVRIRWTVPLRDCIKIDPSCFSKSKSARIDQDIWLCHKTSNNRTAKYRTAKNRMANNQRQNNRTAKGLKGNYWTAKITKRQKLQNGEIQNIETYGTVNNTISEQCSCTYFSKIYSHYKTDKNYKTAKMIKWRIT